MTIESADMVENKDHSESTQSFSQTPTIAEIHRNLKAKSFVVNDSLAARINRVAGSFENDVRLRDLRVLSSPEPGYMRIRRLDPDPPMGWVELLGELNRYEKGVLMALLRTAIKSGYTHIAHVRRRTFQELVNPVEGEDKYKLSEPTAAFLKHCFEPKNLKSTG